MSRAAWLLCLPVICSLIPAGAAIFVRKILQNEPTKPPEHAAEGVRQAIEHRRNQLEQDLKHTFEELAKARDEGVTTKLVADLFLFLDIMMPDWSMNWTVFFINVSELALSLWWLIFYGVFLYRSDINASLREWHAREDAKKDSWLAVKRRSVLAPDGDIADAAPDLVIVFPHPHAKHSDDQSAMPLSSIADVIHPVRQLGSKSDLTEGGALYPRLLSRLGVSADQMWSHTGDTHVDYHDLLREWFKKKSELSRKDARELFVKDLLEALGERMFLKTAAVSSGNGLQLHVLVRLDGTQAMQYYITRNALWLQMKADAVEKLGIHQPRDQLASSPPYLPYDTKVVRELYVAGKLEADDENLLYKNVNPLESRQRFRVIDNEVSQMVDLDAAKDASLILDWYPVHQWNRKERLFNVWGCWDALGITLVQPLPWIRDYFGSRVAFQFAWTGLYAKGLLALSPVAVLFELNVARFFIHEKGFGATRPVFAPAIVLIIWSRVLQELWKQEQDFYLHYWSLDPTRLLRVIRPQFRGARKRANHDHNQYELHRPDDLFSSYSSRKLVATLITLAFTVLVGLSIMAWENIFHLNMNVVASIILSIQIISINAIYTAMVQRLTNWENHKYQNEYFNSFMNKMFLLQCVNNYVPFLYLAVKQEFVMEGNCGEEECLVILRRQLALKELNLLIASIGIFLFTMARVKFMMNRDRLSARLAGEESPPPLSFLEAQFFFVEYRTLQQNQYAIRLLVSLGSTLLFGAVCPMMVPLNLLVFVSQLKLQAYLLTTYSKRPRPRVMEGIGEMLGIVYFLDRLSVLTSSTMVVVFGAMFHHHGVATKVAGWCIFYCLAATVHGLAGWVISKESAELRTLIRRRAHVNNRILDISRRTVPKLDPVPVPQEVMDDNWAAIPTLSELRCSDWGDCAASHAELFERQRSSLTASRST